MAKKITNDKTSNSSPAKKVAAKTAAPVSTPIRNTAIPKVVAAVSPVAARKGVATEDIAKRAYAIWQSGTGGSEQDNWARAERELRGA